MTPSWLPVAVDADGSLAIILYFMLGAQTINNGCLFP